MICRRCGISFAGRLTTQTRRYCSLGCRQAANDVKRQYRHVERTMRYWATVQRYRRALGQSA